MAGRDVHRIDHFFGRALAVCAALVAGLLAGFAFFLVRGALPAIHRFGWSFLSRSVWDPVSGDFGALPLIYGTLVSSLLAIAIAAPLSIGVALFLTELAPEWLARPVGFLVEMLAAIPSVVYGLWGIFVLAPWLRVSIEPFLGKWAGFVPLFAGAPYGVGMLASGIILAIMVTPTISSIAREVFLAVPRLQKEAALALGSTRWEMMRLSILGSAVRGIFGAVILGLGRALGETMAVTMVIGNRHQISASLFSPAQTMASAIANEYVEATTDIHLSALVEVGLVLFAVTLIVNVIARVLVLRRVST